MDEAFAEILPPCPAEALGSQPKRIVIPGGSGQVGQMLAQHLQRRGHRVTVLTRGPYTAQWQTVHWDGLTLGSWVEALESVDAVINLTGRSINCRPTAKNRAEVYASRIDSTRLLHQAFKMLARPPRVWMNASAATLYDRVLDAKGVDLPRSEANYVPGSPNGTNPCFTASVVRAWEEELFAGETPGTRRIALRSAVTFSPVAGNVFAVFANLVRYSLGGTQGNGRQFVPWIHETDYARAVEFLMEREDLEGAFNLAAPNPVRNRELMAALREALDMPNGFPAPALAIRLGALLLGTNPELVLDSCRAVPTRLLEAGFEFQFPLWAEAAEELAYRWSRRYQV
jgi:uncharacterized protein (TIGR01777 family)